MGEERPASLKEVKEGGYLMIDGEPCKATKIELSKPGKHGSSKARVEAVGIFDDRKRSLMKPADSDITIPIIEKRGGQVVSVSSNAAQIMDLSDYTTFETTVPEDMREKVQPGAEITYWRFGSRILLKS